MGATMTNVNILEKGTTAFARDILIGSSIISEAIQKTLAIGFGDAEKIKLGQVPQDQSRDEIISRVVGGVDAICLELRKTLDAYEKSSESRVSKIFLAGGGSLLDGMAKLVGDNLGIETELLNAFDQISFDSKNFDEAYLRSVAPSAAIAMGLALRVADGEDA
jgi:type IV pilus assembly protein PilM